MNVPNLPHEFVRINWASERSRERHEGLIKSASRLFTELEMQAVRAGLKRVTLQSMEPLELEIQVRNLAKHGFVAVPLDKMQSTQTYQSSGGPCDTTKPWTYKVAVGRLKDVSTFIQAYEERDNKAVGALLDYPECCTEFFQRTWVEEQWIDTSLPMADSRTYFTSWSPYCNILLRWLGLRYVSHLPCNFNCEATKLIGKNYHQLAHDIGHRTLGDALYNLLELPVEWSGLHGIGLVETPYLRVEFRTDMLKEKHVIKLAGDTKPLTLVKKPNANGFYTEEAQVEAHDMILDIIRTIPRIEGVIDLGCGDMTLLQKVKKDFDAVIVGVDIDPDKEPTIVSDIFDIDYLEHAFDLALISRNRIAENPDGWSKLLKVLERKIRYLLIYSYNGANTLLPVDNFEFKISARSDRNAACLYERV